MAKELEERIEPLSHFVLVELDKVEDQTRSGISLPIEYQQREQGGATRGKILAIGPTAGTCNDDDNLGAKVGDTVIFARYAGHKFPEDDKSKDRLRILNDDEIMAVVHKK